MTSKRDMAEARSFVEKWARPTVDWNEAAAEFAAALAKVREESALVLRTMADENNAEGFRHQDAGELNAGQRAFSRAHALESAAAAIRQGGKQ